jgi:hypothetical protein
LETSLIVSGLLLDDGQTVHNRRVTYGSPTAQQILVNNLVFQLKAAQIGQRGKSLALGQFVPEEELCNDFPDLV